MSKGIKIGGFGIADPDGDEIWIAIETPHSDFKFRVPANRSELLREAFQRGIQAALNDIMDDDAPFLKPTTIE